MSLSYNIEYPNAGDKTTFIDFIVESNEWFIPKLDTRVDLESYATKLYQYGTKFICNDGDSIVAISIAYINTAPKYSFGSYLVVSPRYEGLSLGFSLLLKTLKFAEENGSKGFRLKMRASNHMLFKFYSKLGFKIIGENTYPGTDIIEYELSKDFL